MFSFAKSVIRKCLDHRTMGHIARVAGADPFQLLLKTLELCDPVLDVLQMQNSDTVCVIAWLFGVLTQFQKPSDIFD